MGRGADEPIGADADRSPEQIQREIEETQARLSDTLDAIQQRLAPRRIMDQVVDMYKNSSSNTTSGIADTIRNNPIPIALVGLGLGWLAWSGTNHPQMDARLRKGRYWAERRGAEARSRSGEYGAKAGSYAREYGETIRERASDWTDRAREAVDSVRDRISGHRDEADSQQVYGTSYTGTSTDRGYGTGGAYRHTNEYGEQAGEQARHYGEQARHRARQGYDSFWHMVDDHPMMAGLVGMVVGAALGASIPASRYENELVGDYSDDLFERTRSYGADMIERATQVARSAAEAGVEAASDAGREEARNQGLTPEQMQEQAERATSNSDTARR
jgi:ElaB/YqjD/DUF883 family membrane-anchored ribosome-binding protein